MTNIDNDVAAILRSLAMKAAEADGFARYHEDAVASLRAAIGVPSKKRKQSGPRKMVPREAWATASVLWHDGVSCREIAERIGSTEANVSFRAKLLGWRKRRAGGGWADEARQQAAE